MQYKTDRAKKMRKGRGWGHQVWAASKDPS